VEAMRVLVVARRSARHQRTATLNQMRQLCFCGPEPIRARFAGLTVSRRRGRVGRCSARCFLPESFAHPRHGRFWP
jgi:hypothetical protein